MIYLNDKISNNNIVGQQFASKHKSLICKNNVGDSVYFSGTQPNNEKLQNRNKLIAYVVGGLALAGGIIFAIVKIRKGKAPSADVGKELTKGIENVAEKSSSSAGSSTTRSSGGHSTYSAGNGTKGTSAGTASKKTFSPQEEELTEKLAEQNHREQQVKNELNQANKEQAELEKQMQKQIDEIINLTKPKNPEIAKEAIPQLIRHNKNLDLKLPDYNTYLNHITPENKDFAIKEGIPLIAENMEKIKSVFNNSVDAHELLGVLNKDNKSSLNILLDKSKILKIKDMSDITSALENITSKNNNILAKEIIPSIEKTPDNFKWLDGWYLGEFMELFKSGNKNGILDILPKVVQNFEKYKIKNDGNDILMALKTITSTNQKFIFEDLFPHLIKNSEKYKISATEDYLNYCKVITPQNKNFIIDKVIPLLFEHAEKLQLKPYSIPHVLEHITQENKDCVPLISENANKLGFSIGYSDASKLGNLLGKGKEGILKEINKS